MSARSGSSAAVFDSSRTPQTSYSSYSLDTYLRGPPEPVTERLVSNQNTLSPTEGEKKTKSELEYWQYNFDEAGKSEGK
ncbi:subtilisin-like protein [Hypoxylon texense]